MLQFVPTNTIGGAYKWDSNKPFESIGNIARGLSKDAAGDIVKIQYQGPGRGFLVFFAEKGVDGAIYLVGEGLDYLNKKTNWQDKLSNWMYEHWYKQ